jgi:type II secretory pathway pseudopilin PulG
MFAKDSQICRLPTEKASGFTLAEVVITVAVTALLFGGIITGYVQSAYKAEWTGYSLAAQALAIQQLEQARAAKWDTQDTPIVTEITNLNLISWGYSGGVWSGYSTNILDLPVAGTNTVVATNYTKVFPITVSAVPLVTIYMVKVDTVWPFMRSGQRVFFTNTIAAYYAPD